MASVKYLPPPVSEKLVDPVTIVGMRFHPGAHERLFEASLLPAQDQHLFLVPDVKNNFDPNAVMIHDGARKLGYVSACEARKVRQVIDELTAAEGRDQVLVIEMPRQQSRPGFKWVSSIKVEVIGYVYERIARKLAQEI